MNLLYRDGDVAVVIKEPDRVSEHTDAKDGFADFLEAELGTETYPVHRLDRGVGGVMVYALTKSAAASLSESVRNGSFQKEYLAVAEGELRPACGRMEDLLFHDRRQNKTFAVGKERAGVKRAALSYTVLRTAALPDGSTVSVCAVVLETGRTHQIRAQFSSRGHALTGDGKYGSRRKGEIGLFCRKLSFPHPRTGKRMEFCTEPSGGIFDIVSSGK